MTTFPADMVDRMARVFFLAHHGDDVFSRGHWDAGGDQHVNREPWRAKARAALAQVLPDGWTDRARVDATMPVFPIKAKDALAIEAVQAYRELCVKYGLYGQAQQVQLAINEITDWQGANEDRMKLPDHKHVPVGHDV